MAGETDLGRLLHTLKPRLLPQDYVFCCLKHPTLEQILGLKPLATFRENEGMTLVLEREQALQQQFEFDGILKCITLSVHSSLQAVGLTAAVASALAENHISANVIAAFYHDHVFVPSQHAQRALTVLENLPAV